jgi:2-oxoglutarate/2-oxoacid ferredoxin oxidoreductase subunit beta
VQSAAGLLATAAMRSRLCATQKNDNPVTQGTGFSVSELILSPDEVLFTGIEKPDALLIVSDDGARELERAGIFSEMEAITLVLADEQVALPELPCRVLRLPFRQVAGPKLAATAAAFAWLNITRAFPVEAFWAALDARYGTQAESVRSKLLALVQDAPFADLQEVPNPAPV